MRIYLIILSTLLLLTGCRHTATDPAIRQAELLADSLPHQALSIIDSIPVSTLSGHDRFLHNYLRIKTEDKLFITHRNDSLLRLVLDYAKSNRRSVDYPELLYYAGRVYSDMGDYPTALENYYKALEEIPEDKDIKLRAKILSNIGYIHTATCLYDKGIEAFSEAIKLDSICGDTLNMMYDLINLGDLNFKLDNYTISQALYNKVLTIAGTSFPEISAEQKINLARTKLYEQQIDSALNLLSDNFKRVEPVILPSAYATAAEIYYYAGELDSAYYYANEVIRMNNSSVKNRAYSILLAKGLIERLPKDSIYSLTYHLIQNTNKTIKRNSEKAIVIQLAQYNYAPQQDERFRAEEYSKTLRTWIFNLIIILLLLIILSLCLLLRSKKQKLKLVQFENDITFLKNELIKFNQNNTDSSSDSSTKRDELKKELLDTILNIIYDTNYIPQKNQVIVNSSPYQSILKCARSRMPINTNDPVWKDLIEVIKETNPKFLYNLELLLEKPLSDNQLQIVLLTKCLFTPTEISVIMNRTKGTISHHRENIGIMIFGKKISVKIVDLVISLL